MRIYTVGHSTRSLQDFINLLKHYNVQLLIDVRRFPSSKKFPWFNLENLKAGLVKERISYVHFPELGGYRREGYKNFAKSKEFSRAIEKLLKIIDKKIAIIMCAELKWQKCHRKYIADVLVRKGYEVMHIISEGKTQLHNPLDQVIKERMKTKIYCDRTKSANW